MELDHVILADLIAPRPDGKLDLHGVGWDTIFAAVLPATHPRMDVAIRFPSRSTSWRYPITSSSPSSPQTASS